MEKVLFIVPPYSDYDSFVNPAFNDSRMTKKTGEFKRLVTDMPIGLLSLSAYIKKNTDVCVRLLDFNILLNEIVDFDYESFANLFEDIFNNKEWSDFNPTVIGISALFTPVYHNMLDMANVLRLIFPQSLIMAGGFVPTNMFEEIFQESTSFDALCYGEGEKPLLALLQAKSSGENMTRF
ncbi:MAG: cobalamin B12-binding domain-containing protein, partial [Thermodesulfobacteriota bacterium]|nr:cobalamin B12-binding domain-containing protein [Thermodesulfobacteriota bacterium]